MVGYLEVAALWIGSLRGLAAGWGGNSGGEQKGPSLSSQNGDSWGRRTAMTKEFENPNETKVEDETILNATRHEKIEHVADKAAGKAARAEQKYDQENISVITK
jgi:hypothetical protein